MLYRKSHQSASHGEQTMPKELCKEQTHQAPQVMQSLHYAVKILKYLYIYVYFAANLKSS